MLVIKKSNRHEPRDFLVDDDVKAELVLIAVGERTLDLAHHLQQREQRVEVISASLPRRGPLHKALVELAVARHDQHAVLVRDRDDARRLHPRLAVDLKRYTGAAGDGDAHNPRLREPRRRHAGQSLARRHLGGAADGDDLKQPVVGGRRPERLVGLGPPKVRAAHVRGDVEHDDALQPRELDDLPVAFKDKRLVQVAAGLRDKLATAEDAIPHLVPEPAPALIGVHFAQSVEVQRDLCIQADAHVVVHHAELARLGLRDECCRHALGDIGEPLDAVANGIRAGAGHPGQIQKRTPLRVQFRNVTGRSTRHAHDALDRVTHPLDGFLDRRARLCGPYGFAAKFFQLRHHLIHVRVAADRFNGRRCWLRRLRGVGRLCKGIAPVRREQTEAATVARQANAGGAEVGVRGYGGNLHAPSAMRRIALTSRSSITKQSQAICHEEHKPVQHGLLGVLHELKIV
eukprot:m.151028 g.151028  ORF g.151028 m.151028 type:complete len:459 (-) comp9754_c0_seq5:1293-2669(-)